MVLRAKDAVADHAEGVGESIHDIQVEGTFPVRHLALLIDPD
jgi:urease gamma subunit